MSVAMMGGLVGGALMLALLGSMLLRADGRQRLVGERLVAVQRQAGLDQVSAPRSLLGLPVRALAAFGGLLTRGGLLPAKTLRELEQTLLAAGFRGDRALAIFVGGKVLALVLMPGLMFAALSFAGVKQPWLAYGVGAAAVLGLLGPDMIAKRLRMRYLRQVQKGLPDALDLMIICSEAGLSLETAVERVGREIRPANPEVATEFDLCASELRILSDRRAALENMAARTGIDQLRRLSMTLIQTLQFGTPLSQALRTLAAEMRHEQLMKFEEQAAKLPVKLTVPMILCILPTLFMVVAGPAALKLMRTW